MSDPITLTARDAQLIWDAAETARKERAKAMPTEKDALRVMFDAYQRLEELGWRPAMYCPKDGTIFDSISAGSTGIHDSYYDGEWPKGRYWTFDGGDLWPGNPILFREKKDKPQ